MNKPVYTVEDTSKFDPENCFWESALYFKSYFSEIKNKNFSYYDDSNVLRYLFYHWVSKWVMVLCKKYVEPYKIHPLMVSDQILRWEPIFSKHISDGLVRLDLHQFTKSTKKHIKPYSSILLRAILLTCWKKAFVLFFGLVVGNVLSMSITILVEKLLNILNDSSIHVSKTILLLVAIVCFQILDGLLLENINFYIFRMIYIFHYLYSIIPYRYALSHRRVYYNNVDGSNFLSTCNEVLHSCAPDSECSKNPLFCPAMRYQNREISPKVFTYVFYDSYYIAVTFEAVKYIIQFLSNFIYGVYLLSRLVKTKLWVLYLVGAIFLIVMVAIEIFNAYIFKYILYMRDYKVTKYNDIFGSLNDIKKMFCDDIGFNIITQTRNNELSLIFVKIFITFINVCLYSTSINISFYIIKRYFVKSVNDATIITDINTAGFITTFYVFLRIITSMFLIPRAINVIGMAYISYKRVNKYLKNCSPNFYNTGNKFSGSTNLAVNLNNITTKLPNDVVVYYKDASFTWVHSRENLLNKNYDIYLKNVNFELKRGQIVIITGSQGSGKSNFIKSMLGDMTLVGGSMAVVPLHTSMPIFYASQDIYLRKGTVRSNITFGYRFDEHIYNVVLKAVELAYDISTWEKGDLRVVSDNAPSLSGGQRVRMEMARAVYAYLVFHQVNKEYNNRNCSFLMCLDASFHGLDPYVSKTIFNNLFNSKNGLLVRDDLSVILTSSKLNLDTCTKFSDSLQFPNCPIYNIKNHELTFYSYLDDFIKNKRHDVVHYKYLSSTRTGPYQLHTFNNDMINLCTGSDVKLGHSEITKDQYRDSFRTFVRDYLAGVKFNPFFVFMKPALSTFLLYILLTIAFNVMDYVKFVLSTNLSDYINKNINDYNDGVFVDLAEIKSRSNSSLNVTVIFVTLIIILAFIATLAISFGSLVSCRKLHEYCVNTIFKYSSSVIKIKKQISQVITYLSCDLMMMDDITGLFISMLLFSAIQTTINIITLFYLIPISVPFILVTLVLANYYVLKNYIISARSLNFGFLESLGHMNSVIENTISGSSVYRSFKKDSELFRNFIEHRDYNSRTKFLFAAIVSWSSVLFNWIFSLTTLIILVLPIILDKYTKYKMTVGYFGLALSLCMNVIKSYSNFAFLYAHTQVLMGSIERFQYFIPLGQKLKFDPFPNTHDEYVVSPINKDLTKIDKRQLLRRRAIEFKTNNRRFYGLRRLFYHPRLTIVDSTLYLSPEHSGVELKNVCVYTSPEHNPDGMILKHLTVSTHRSEMIGMVGRTGAGKTTLLSVLQNTIGNRTGQVLLDGKDLNDVPKIVLRQIIGVLPQHPFVFKGWTVRRFLDPRKLFTDDDINQALNKCGLLNFVNELHGGNKLDTFLTPEEPLLYNSTPKSNHFYKNASYNMNKSMLNTFYNSDYVAESILSYNQLRTLSLARLVLYRHFYRMIVVDEPPDENLVDSVKDDTMGVQIYDLLQKYFSHCTTFVTAHDVNVLKMCTSVWVIHEGCLVRTCKTNDIAANESISKIIEQSLNYG